MKVYLYIIILITSLTGYSQNSEKERLLLKKDSIDSYKDKVQLYTDLAWEYTLEENDSALIYCNKALKISNNNNYPLGKAMTLEAMGLYYEITKGNFEKASNNYFKAIEICETHQLEYLAEIFHTVGIMFHSSDNYEKAKEYYVLSYQKALKNNNLSLQKKSLGNLGALYSSLEEFDKAEETMLKSLDIDIHPEMDYITYTNLGYYYVKNKDFNKAFYYLEKATERHPDNEESEINLFHLIHAKVMANDISNMDSIISRAELAAKTVPSIRDRSLLLRNIADYYELKGDYKMAVEFRNKYVEVYEEIKEKQRDEIVHELETKYETEKKDAQLKVLKLETEKKEKQNQIYLVLIVAGLFIAGLLGYFGYRNQKKNNTLAKQKTLLENALDEKNTLLKEVHHRVKNSFQIVSSLLYLQSENVNDSEAKIAIKEAENRVRSMILIHQKLYNKDALVGINVQEYINDLTKDIIESHLTNPKSVETKLDIEPYVLDLATITPLGLILNELITNVIKHAYDDLDDKFLKITLKKENHQLVLNVVDNGKKPIKIHNESSFGITLMKALSKKLQAHLDVKKRDHKEGTAAKLIINRFQILS